MAAVDHYGEAELALERAILKPPADPGHVFSQPEPGPTVELSFVLLAAVHALLALVDAIDDAGGSNRP